MWVAAGSSACAGTTLAFSPTHLRTAPLHQAQSSASAIVGGGGGGGKVFEHPDFKLPDFKVPEIDFAKVGRGGGVGWGGRCLTRQGGCGVWPARVGRRHALMFR